LDADRGGMDRHPRLLGSVADFTAPAEWPAAWSRCTATGSAINSLGGKFAVGVRDFSKTEIWDPHISSVSRQAGQASGLTAVLASPRTTRYALQSQAFSPCRGSGPLGARKLRHRREPVRVEPVAAAARCRAGLRRRRSMLPSTPSHAHSAARVIRHRWGGGRLGQSLAGRW
jgi:hypothetical protein